MALATTAPPTRVQSADRRAVVRSGRFVWTVAVLAVVVRLPFAAAPAGADEAGFLQVAHQWSPGGGSLYGHYWVDRPPLLITLFRIADATGGIVSLRLLGCVAVASTVLLSARAAHRLAGSRAARWTALVAGSLLVSPLMGSQEVNGELLSAPFVAAGVLSLVEATRTPVRSKALLLGALAGVAGLSALMVKQNIADVFVFATVYLAAGSRWRTIPGTRLVALGALSGIAATSGAIAAWTVMHGTSLVGVFDAMYAFRLQASHVMAAGDSQYASGRALRIALAWVASGAALLTAALVLATLRSRSRDAATMALAATAAYDTVSIALGGGYWLHYLVEIAVPLAIWCGVLVARGKLVPRIAAVIVAVVAVVTLVGTGIRPAPSDAEAVGAAIAGSAHPGDTLTTLYGDPAINLAAGLPSPYPHLWSLPIKTLDPQLTGLDTVLSGPNAPTWVVVSHHVSSWGLDSTRTELLISTDYRPVAQIDGQTIYLHDGITRTTPSPTPSRSSTTQEQP